MKRFALLTTVLTAVLTLLLPFVGGSGPSLTGDASAFAADSTTPIYASSPVAAVATHNGPVNEVLLVKTAAATAKSTAAYLASDSEHLGQKPVPVPVVVAAPAAEAPAASGAAGNGASGNRASGSGNYSRAGSGNGSSSRGGSGNAAASAAPQGAAPAAGGSCPAAGGGGGSAPGGSEQGVGGTTSGDIRSFSASFNAIRAAHCLQPIASNNFRYDSCMEQRLYWMAEDPSTNPLNTWGHSGVRSLAPDANGVYYSNAVPAKGCDGNLAGGSGNSGATVAQKWWDSLSHRASLYRPSVGSTAGVCIYFAMTHGGVPGESSGFTRAAARWSGC